LLERHIPGTRVSTLVEHCLELGLAELRRRRGTAERDPGAPAIFGVN
jgi:hypothetical protein